MNRYITVLLVVLAATGVEAQKYESALKLAMADISYREVFMQPEAESLEQDILSVIQALKQASEEEHAKQTTFGRIALGMPAPTPGKITSPVITPSETYVYEGYFDSNFIRGPTSLRA